MCKSLKAGGHCPVSSCNPTMWPYNYAQGMKVIFLITVKKSLRKTENKAEGKFCNILCNSTIPRWAL
jgi:hypothetical protein